MRLDQTTILISLAEPCDAPPGVEIRLPEWAEGAAPSALPADTLFDTDRIAAIQAVVGRASIDGLLALFEKELLVRPLKIAELLHTGLLTQAGLELHDLKGAALNIGAVALGDHVRLLEQECRDGAVAGDRIDRLIAITHATLRWLRTRARTVPA